MMKSKPLPLAPDRYLVSSDGGVFGLINSQGNPRGKPKRLSQFDSHGQYPRVGLRFVRGGKIKHICVHTLVLLTFRGPPPSPKHECGHRDGNPQNNRIGNLRWVTRKENAADKDRHGNTVWGERATRGKLTEEQVIATRILHEGGFSLARIGGLFSVSPQAIQKIVIGKAWARL